MDGIGKGKQVKVLMVKKEFGVGDEGFSDEDKQQQQQLMGYDYSYESNKKKRVMIDSAVAAHSGGGGVIRKVCSGGGLRLCQVEKCGADLSGAKAYHRRHKVCELHAKSQVVLVEGVRQRFCQQCSRFHELSEFDDTKRSCRRRLAGHNERRRKNAAETHEGEGSSGRKSSNSSSTHELNDMVCGGQFDDRERIKISIQENATYKHFQIR